MSWILIQLVIKLTEIFSLQIERERENKEREEWLQRKSETLQSLYTSR